MRTSMSLSVLGLAVLVAGGCASSGGYDNTYRVGSSATVGASQAQAVLAERIAAEAKTSSGEPLPTPIRLIEGAPPAMPRGAIDNRIEGTVRVVISFNERGTVSKVAVVSSPSELLSAAVVQAVARWRVEPTPAFTANQSFTFKASQ